MKPRPITADERSCIASMLRELNASALTVALVPAPRPMHRGHCVRQVISENPDWYRRLADCANAPTRRKGRNQRQNNRVRRYQLVKAMKRALRTGEFHGYPLDAVIAATVKELQAEDQERAAAEAPC